MTLSEPLIGRASRTKWPSRLSLKATDAVLNVVLVALLGTLIFKGKRIFQPLSALNSLQEHQEELAFGAREGGRGFDAANTQCIKHRNDDGKTFKAALKSKRSAIKVMKCLVMRELWRSIRRSLDQSQMRDQMLSD